MNKATMKTKLTAAQWEARILAGQTKDQDFTANRRYRKAANQYSRAGGRPLWIKMQYYDTHQQARIVRALGYMQLTTTTVDATLTRA